MAVRRKQKPSTQKIQTDICVVSGPRGTDQKKTGILEEILLENPD
jgi:hypothetical protein